MKKTLFHKRSLTLTMLLLVTVIDYGHGTTAPASFSCNTPERATYNNSGTPASGWFSNFKTQTPGNFLFEFTTNATSDMNIFFSPRIPTLDTNWVPTDSFNKYLRLLVGGWNNGQQGVPNRIDIGLPGQEYVSASQQFGTKNPLGRVKDTQGYTRYKVALNQSPTKIQVWAKVPGSDNSTYTLVLDSSSESTPTEQLQYFSFACGSPNPTIYKDVTILAATTAPMPPPVMKVALATTTAPASFSCNTPERATYNNSGTTGSGWFSNFKTQTPGNFLFEFTTNATSDMNIFFSPTIPTLDTNWVPKDSPSRYLRLLVGGWNNGQQGLPNRLDIGLPGQMGLQASKQFGTKDPLGSVKKPLGSIKDAQGDTRYKIALNQLEKKIQIWAKVPGSDNSTYMLVLDSSSESSVAFGFGCLDSSLGLLQYFSFACGSPNPTIYKDVTMLYAQ